MDDNLEDVRREVENTRFALADKIERLENKIERASPGWPPVISSATRSKSAKLSIQLDPKTATPAETLSDSQERHAYSWDDAKITRYISVPANKSTWYAPSVRYLHAISTAQSNG